MVLPTTTYFENELRDAYDRLRNHDPWAYITDVLTRLPTHLNSRIDELLPHNWRPAR
ncbi:hypothetical protein CS8_011730 [Cupriavidus sp. 8B]